MRYSRSFYRRLSPLKGRNSYVTLCDEDYFCILKLFKSKRKFFIMIILFVMIDECWVEKFYFVLLKCLESSFHLRSFRRNIVQRLLEWSYNNNVSHLTVSNFFDRRKGKFILCIKASIKLEDLH